MSDEPVSQRRRGKIAQCPRTIREEVCRRLDDGQQGPEILAWLNAQPEVVSLTALEWEGHAISDNNLSQWFKGGFLDWQRQQIEVESTTRLAEFSMRLARETGGSMAEGVVAMAGGKILSALEGAEGDHLIKLVAGAASLRGVELDKEKVGISREKTAIARDAVTLDREKFERLAVAKFIDWAANEEARAIATGAATKEVKMDQLIQLMFGQRPAPAANA
jgi:hypothetical protein